MATIEVTDTNFETEVLQSDLPVLVDFWATWCAPCRAVAPVLEELSEELEGKLRIGKVDVDANPMLSQQLRIQSIPTLVMFVDGRPVDGAQGALPKEELRAFIEKHLPELKSPVITVEELAGLIDAGRPVQVFDIRDPRDVSRSHLRHARCVPEAELAAAIGELSPDTIVVLVDRTGEGAEAAAVSLAATVTQPVLALQKGLLEWEGSGRPTYNDREEAALDA